MGGDLVLVAGPAMQDQWLRGPQSQLLGAYPMAIHDSSQILMSQLLTSRKIAKIRLLNSKICELKEKKSARLNDSEHKDILMSRTIPA
jgi:hypothetical protein